MLEQHGACGSEEEDQVNALVQFEHQLAGHFDVSVSAVGADGLGGFEDFYREQQDDCEESRLLTADDGHLIAADPDHVGDQLVVEPGLQIHDFFEARLPCHQLDPVHVVGQQSVRSVVVNYSAGFR